MRAWTWTSRTIVAWAAAIAIGACADAPTDPVDFGALIARDSLTALNGDSLPCCGYTDKSGARVTILGGTMAVYGPAHWTDTAYTPAGPFSKACVQEIPNGAHVYLNGLVVLPDSTSYLLFGCSRGEYTVVLTRRLDFGTDSSRTDTVMALSGDYTWSRDTLNLIEIGPPESATASLAGPIITVTVPDHRYRFLAVRAY